MKETGKAGSLVLLLLALWIFPGRQFAQFIPDESFGQEGHLFLNEDTVTSVVYSLSLAGDSLLVLSQVGPVSASLTDRDVLLSKFAPNGDPDTNFGQGGILRFDFDSLSYSTGIYLLEEPDGSFLVLGSGKPAPNSLRTWACVQRVSSGGKLLPLSPSYPTLRVEVLGLEEYPNVIQRDAANRYLIAGSSFDPLGNHPQPVMLRFTEEWEMDSTFGGTGKMTFDFGATQFLRDERVHFSGGFIRDLVPLPDSGFAICGALSDGDHYVGFVAGISNDGSLETGFCPPFGYKSFDLFGNYDTRIQGLERLPDGTLVFAGSTHPGNPEPDILLGRLNPKNGSFTHEKIRLGETKSEFADLALFDGDEVLVLGTREDSEGKAAMGLIHVVNPENLEIQTTTIYSPDSSFDVRGNVLLAQTNRIVMGGFQRAAGAHISGLLTAVHLPATSTQFLPKASLKLSFFPNPTHDHLTIRCSAPIEKVSVWSLEGKLCFEQKAGRENELKLQLPFLSAGPYILSVNEQWRERIIIQ